MTDNTPETQEDQGSNISPTMVVFILIILSTAIYALTVLKKFYTSPLRPVFPKEVGMELYLFVD